jgi:hypothetical protein
MASLSDIDAPKFTANRAAWNRANPEYRWLAYPAVVAVARALGLPYRMPTLEYSDADAADSCGCIVYAADAEKLAGLAETAERIDAKRRADAPAYVPLDPATVDAKARRVVGDTQLKLNHHKAYRDSLSAAIAAEVVKIAMGAIRVTITMEEIR